MSIHLAKPNLAKTKLEYFTDQEIAIAASIAVIAKENSMLLPETRIVQKA